MQVRGRYLDALRCGANIHDATEFANASPQEQPRYIPINVHEAPVPQGYGKPGEVAQLLPDGWAIGKPPDTDEKKVVVVTEHTKPLPDPVAQPALSLPLPEPPPKPKPPPVPVLPQVQHKALIEQNKDIIDLLVTGREEEVTWPKIRTLCMQLGLRSPRSRLDGANAIKKALVFET